MSVQHRPNGTWQVTWREGARQRARTFTRKRDAEAFDAEVKRRKQLGPIAVQMMDAGAETLGEYVATTFAPGHMSHLAPTTARRYASQYAVHIAPFLGDVPLRELTADRIARWQSDRLKAGTGPVGVAKASTLLGSILQRAVESGRLVANPQRLVRKPKRPQTREVRPLAPARIEQMREYVLHPPAVPVSASREGQRPRRAYSVSPKTDPQTRQRDATLLSVLGYAGLRPGEALDLQWGNVQHRTIVVNAAKTGQRRTVRVLAPLAADMAAWKLASTDTTDGALVFPGIDGGRWPDEAYRSWARRTFTKAAEAAGRPDATPYTLRHSFASLLLHEGRSVIYVARQLGHGAALTLSTYGHVIEELDDAPNVSAEDAIRAARGEDVGEKLARTATASRLRPTGSL